MCMLATIYELTDVAGISYDVCRLNTNYNCKKKIQICLQYYVLVIS